MDKNKYKGYALYSIILIGLLALTMLLLRGETVYKLSYSQILNLFDEQKVVQFSLKDSTLKIQLKEGENIGEILYADVKKPDKNLNKENIIKQSNIRVIKSANSPNNQIFEVKVAYPNLLINDLDDTIKEQRKQGILKYEINPPTQTSWIMSWLPLIIILIISGLAYFLMFRQMNGGGKVASFSKAKIKMGSENGKKVTFKDVAGAKEEKEELEEIVEFLKAPRKFMKLGARIPKGVLLVGPPGTGKTLLAKAVAGEAGVPFFSISGSDFVELYVGIGASRVRNLFSDAKKNAPCIIFIDEIDAVGRKRGAGLGGGHDEREQTLNQMLVEMDGFGANEGVIVMAATNRADVLDPALLRPGRFDRQVFVGLPDIKGREEILKVHARGKIFADNVEFKTIAKGTPGFSGADLENVLNEAALIAARNNKKAITMQDMQNAVNKVMIGPEKKSRVITEKERKLTAYHEAGHAITTYMQDSQDPVHQISIIPTGMAGGYTLSLPTEDKYYNSKTEMIENIVTLLGGRAAEHLVLDDISTGASNDIERATSIATNMVTRYGMSERLGPRIFGSDNDEVFIGRDFGHTRNYSENIAAQIDDEIKNIIDSAYDKAISILEDNRDKLEVLAQRLMKNEKVEGDEFVAIMKGEDPDEVIKNRPAPKTVSGVKTIKIDKEGNFIEEEVDLKSFNEDLFNKENKDTNETVISHENIVIKPIIENKDVKADKDNNNSDALESNENKEDK